MRAKGADPGELGGNRGGGINSGNARSLPRPPGEVIRHSGPLAPGVLVSFQYDPATGELGSSLSGDPRRHPRGDVMRRYRALRHEFFERVAAVIGGPVAMLETDEDGHADSLHVIDEPKAGLA